MVKLNHYSINDDKNIYNQTNKIIENFGLKKTVEFFDLPFAYLKYHPLFRFAQLF